MKKSPQDLLLHNRILRAIVTILRAFFFILRANRILRAICQTRMMSQTLRQ
mgnify:CR=1 FL=1